MVSSDGWALRDRVARPVLARIAIDAGRAPAAIGRLLHHVHDHLFDPDLTVGSMVRACGYASRATADAFPRAVGRTAKAYITEQRMAIAQQLLGATSLRVADIGRLVGIRDATTFSRSVSRRFGASPRALRRQIQRTDTRLTVDDDATTRPWLDLLATWRGLEARAATQDSRFDSESSARLRAETAWSLARNLEPRARRALVTRAALVNPYLVEHVASRSRIEGRGDRARGVAMAALAVASVPAAPNDAWTAEEIARARVSSRVWHANALRLALDYPAADAVLTRARSILESSSCPIPPDVEIRLFEIGGSLNLYWSRPERAATYSERAIEFAETHEEPVALVRVLLGRAAIHGFVGDFEAALRCLGRAQALIEVEPAAAHLAFGVASNTCVHRYQAGDGDGALRDLSRAKILACAIPDPLARAYVEAMEGRLLLESGSVASAIRLLSAACNTFLDRQAYLYQVVFGLDLCLARLWAGEPSSALEHARSLIPLMSAIPLDRELSAVARLIEAGVRQGSIRRAAVQEARKTMDRLSFRPGLHAQLSSDWIDAR